MKMIAVAIFIVVSFIMVDFDSFNKRGLKSPATMEIPILEMS